MGYAVFVMHASTLTTDTWQLNGTDLTVEFRSAPDAVFVNVTMRGPTPVRDAMSFVSLGAAERWYVRFSRQLQRMGAARTARSVVEAYGNPHDPFVDLRGGRRTASSPPPPPLRQILVHESYTVLGVRPGVHEPELRTAYRQLALKWHPDRSDDPRAEATMGMINRAYDDIRRREGMQP